MTAHNRIESKVLRKESNLKAPFLALPLWDMPTERHLWKRQYWHLFRFFFWILQRRSHLSYSNLSRIVLLKKPWRRHKIHIQKVVGAFRYWCYLTALPEAKGASGIVPHVFLKSPRVERHFSKIPQSKREQMSHTMYPIICAFHISF